MIGGSDSKLSHHYFGEGHASAVPPKPENDAGFSPWGTRCFDSFYKSYTTHAAVPHTKIAECTWLHSATPRNHPSAVYCTVSVNVAAPEMEPLVPVTVTVKLPVGVPETTLKSVGLDDPPPGAGFVTTTG